MEMKNVVMSEFWKKLIKEKWVKLQKVKENPGMLQQLLSNCQGNFNAVCAFIFVT